MQKQLNEDDANHNLKGFVCLNIIKIVNLDFLIPIEI